MEKRKFTDFCRECGGEEDEHHVFNPYLIPEACVCPPEDWREPDKVPDVCAEFVPMNADSATCLKCEHEDNCHGAVA